MKFVYGFLFAVLFAACVQADVDTTTSAPKNVGFLHGIWNKVTKWFSLDNLLGELDEMFAESEQGKAVAEGEGNSFVELVIWIYQNKDEILNYIYSNVLNALNDLKTDNPVCDAIDNLKETNFLPTEKKVSAETLKPLLEKLESLKNSNPIVKIFFSPISNAIHQFTEKNSLCILLDTFQASHPIFSVVKYFAEYNSAFALVEDIFNDSKACLCSIVNPTDFALQVIG